MIEVSAATIGNHIDYTIWASNRLLSAAFELSPEQRLRDFGTADKSIQGTLLHLLRSERTWLHRIQQDAPDVSPLMPEDEQWEVLITQWPRVQQAWQDWASGLADSDAHRIVEYADLKGRPWSNAVWQIVLHVVNHSTHHRGQVSGFLRSTGITPPPLDFIAFIRKQTAPK